MTSFGFSAFVKLVSLTARPQRSEIRKRLTPTNNAYDYHRSLRLRAAQLLGGRASLEDVLASAQAIGNPAERNSCTTGLTQLNNWRISHPYPLIHANSSLYHSPSELFRVNYTPDFGVNINGTSVGIHIWNTISPAIDARFLYAALHMASSAYNGLEDDPDDVALLSLRNGQLYRLSDVTNQAALARLLADRLETIFDEVSDELRQPAQDRNEPPSAPSLR